MTPDTQGMVERMQQEFSGADFASHWLECQPHSPTGDSIKLGDLAEAVYKAALTALAQRVAEVERERDEYKQALEAMVWQFANRFVRDGKFYLSTMGLSALEEAFDVLKWDDPQVHEGDGLICEHCHAKHSTCGTRTAQGYKRLCGDCFIQVQPPDAEGKG